MTRLSDRFGAVTERLDRIGWRLATTEEAITDAMAGQPGAASYDAIGRSNMKSVLWCDEHQQELADCHRQEHTCSRGIPIPVHPDPTGDAAVNHDKARSDERQLRKAIHTLENVADLLESIHGAYATREPTAAEKRATEQDNDKGQCEVCSRSDVYTPAIVTSSNAKGNLPRHYRLCRWHLDFTLSYGRLPNDAEEKRHHDGGRVHVRAS